ncbi:hypothetical protein [Iodobacter fluviatilis]|uniref:Uncharacterized protein n=1 Tax=Iodobacter fluviatilis TaxID=537 RepID=A0A377Q5R5_9NEIS|nr:hypothetical protein [Iodobacter fluviatilis]TCU81170.1 hypothetical protein EV682_1261 [Iodobacter fluviatilis]STQ90147.1 Uncharacterised protein [Iodobacter fluviatilis]
MTIISAFSVVKNYFHSLAGKYVVTPSTSGGVASSNSGRLDPLVAGVTPSLQTRSSLLPLTSVSNEPSPSSSQAKLLKWNGASLSPVVVKKCLDRIIKGGGLKADDFNRLPNDGLGCGRAKNFFLISMLAREKLTDNSVALAQLDKLEKQYYSLIEEHSKNPKASGFQAYSAKNSKNFIKLKNLDLALLKLIDPSKGSASYKEHTSLIKLAESTYVMPRRYNALDDLEKNQSPWLKNLIGGAIKSSCGDQGGSNRLTFLADAVKAALNIPDLLVEEAPAEQSNLVDRMVGVESSADDSVDQSGAHTNSPQVNNNEVFTESSESLISQYNSDTTLLDKMDNLPAETSSSLLTGGGVMVRKKGEDKHVSDVETLASENVSVWMPEIAANLPVSEKKDANGIEGGEVVNEVMLEEGPATVLKKEESEASPYIAEHDNETLQDKPSSSDQHGSSIVEILDFSTVANSASETASSSIVPSLVLSKEEDVVVLRKVRGLGNNWQVNASENQLKITKDARASFSKGSSVSTDSSPVVATKKHSVSAEDLSALNDIDLRQSDVSNLASVESNMAQQGGGSAPFSISAERSTFNIFGETGAAAVDLMSASGNSQGPFVQARAKSYYPRALGAPAAVEKKNTSWQYMYSPTPLPQK